MLIVRNGCSFRPLITACFRSCGLETSLHKRLFRHMTHSTTNANPFELRDYQKEAVKSVLDAIDHGIKRPAVVLATGGGKTVVMSHLIPRIPSKSPERSKVLVLAHKEELVRQTAQTLRAMNPRLKVDIDMLKQKPSPNANVIVGSVNTLVRLTRLHQYDAGQFKAIVLDECHHAAAVSWTKILNYFDALKCDLDIVVLGFTATLERTDGKALGNVFEKVVYYRGLREMIEQKELCDAQFATMRVDLDLDSIKVREGDYNVAQLAEAVNNADINAQVAKAYLQLRDELALKSTLVFCVDIEHCVTLCGVLQAHGVNAQYVTGETAKHVRKEILDSFRNGDIAVLCNVLVFTEGTDIPNIDSLILARPTRSRPLLTQMVGRGLRLHREKTVCHVIDMANTMKVGVSSVPKLFGLPEGHTFEKKTFRELADEALDETAENEKQVAEKRANDVRELIEIQEKLENLRLQFDVIDGFAAMTNYQSETLRAHPSKVHEAFRNSGYDWVRLEYDIWGIDLTKSDSFLIIERLDEHENALNFVLRRVYFVSPHVLKALNWKFLRKQSTLLDEGNLDYLLLMCPKHIGRPPFRPLLPKQITPKQLKYICNTLAATVRNKYGKEAYREFERLVNEMPMRRASKLILAMRWSVKSLWVLWELKNLMGIPPKLQKQMAKEEKRAEEQMKKLDQQTLEGATKDLDQMLLSPAKPEKRKVKNG